VKMASALDAIAFPGVVRFIDRGTSGRCVEFVSGNRDVSIFILARVIV